MCIGPVDRQNTYDDDENTMVSEQHGFNIVICTRLPAEILTNQQNYGENKERNKKYSKKLAKMCNSRVLKIL